MIRASGSAVASAARHDSASRPGICSSTFMRPRAAFEIDQVRAFLHAVAGTVVDRGDRAVRRCGDRVLHLHRLENHQRRSASDLVPGLDQHGDDRSGHRCRKMAAVRFHLACVRKGVDEKQLPVLAATEHVTLLAMRNNGGVEFGAARDDTEMTIVGGHRCNGLARRQFHTPRIAVATHIDLVPDFAIVENECQRMPRAVRPPGIDGVPRRIRISRSCARATPGQRQVNRLRPTRRRATRCQAAESAVETAPRDCAR